jgi:microcin C transport system substrate-binding protein|tara:strand:+ start:1441 stop:3390 length:1950 start_codon:yes stop_codon:yes gene_type:complete
MRQDHNGHSKQPRPQRPGFSWRTGLGRALFGGLLLALANLPGATPSQAQQQTPAATPTQAQTATGPITQSWAMAEFGAARYDAAMAYFPYVNPNAPKGGAITLGAFGSFDSLNTYILKGDWPRSIGLTSDSLMTGSGDELSAAYGLIAESVAYPQDKSWITFTLRPEARYHDGSPILADDFAFVMEVIKKYSRPFLKSFYEEVESWEVLDDRRIKFVFNTRNNMKPLMNVASLSPLSRRYWTSEGRDITKTTLTPPLSSGPYKISLVEAGKSLVYERVADYWAKDLNVNIGQNNIDRIRYDYYVDPTVMFEAFKAGKIDFRSENRSQRWATGYDIEPVKDGRILKVEEPNNNPRGIQAYFMNQRRAQFADQRIRQAINLLYDFEAIRKTLLFGYYARINSYFPNSDFGASGPPTEEEIALLTPFKEQLAPEVLSQAFRNPVSDGSGRIRGRTREALALFKAVGWVLKDGKMFDTEGQQVKIEFLLASPSSERITAPFVDNLKKVGIDASIRIVDTSQYQVRLDDFDYDIILVSLNFFPPPGAEQRSYWGSAAADIRGSANLGGIRNPVIDQLIEQVIQAKDLKTLKATNRAMDRVLLWNYYTVPLFYLDQTWMAYWNKFDRPKTRAKYSTGFPTSWWINPEKEAALAKQ